MSVAYHFRSDTTEIGDLSLVIAGRPDAGGRCPSCLSLRAEMNGGPFPAVGQKAPRACTNERTRPNARQYRGCLHTDDAYVERLDLAAAKLSRGEKVTTFRLTDGRTTFTASFQNLFAERKLVMSTPRGAVIRDFSNVELTWSPDTDAIRTDDTGVRPDTEVLFPGGERIVLEPELSATTVRFPSSGFLTALLSRAPATQRGPGTLIVRYVEATVGVTTCTGPRFCTAIVPGLAEEKRLPVTVSP